MNQDCQSSIDFSDIDDWTKDLIGRERFLWNTDFLPKSEIFLTKALRPTKIAPGVWVRFNARDWLVTRHCRVSEFWYLCDPATSDFEIEKEEALQIIDQPVLE